MVGKIKNTLRYPLRHKKISIILLIVIIILAVVFWPKPPEPLDTQKVEKGDVVEAVTVNGTVQSRDSVQLSFISGGKLVYLGAKKGDMVKAGQVIATLDQRSIQKTLETKLKDYAQQRNTFEQAQDDNNANSPEDAVNDEIKRIMQNNQHDLDKATLAVELQQLAREQAVLTSPIAGVVIRSDVTTAGVNISPTTTFVIADPDQLVFQMEIDEADIGKIRPGQSAKITLDSYPDESFDVAVDTIDFASHATSTGGIAYTVETNLPNSAMQYRIGMSGDAEIVIAQKRDVLYVSLAALTDDNYVFVKKEKGFEKRKVETGIQSDTEIEVVKGLSVNEEVALQPDEAAKQVQK